MDIYVRRDVNNVDFHLSGGVTLVKNTALCFQTSLKICKMHSNLLILNVDIVVLLYMKAKTQLHVQQMTCPAP